jgi:putative transposase
VEEKLTSVTRACRVVSIDRKTYGYVAKLKPKNEMIKVELMSLSARYPRYGFKKLFDLLQAEGLACNHKRAHRLYCELKLNLKRKPKKRLAERTKRELAQPAQLNECWSLDYMSDSLTHGRRFRTANVIDDCNRECLGIKASLSLPSRSITRWLDRVADFRCYPKQIRVDNGPENIASHFQTWAKSHDIEVLYIQPGKPAQNGYIERFNRSYREEVLEMYLFENIRQVQLLTNDWITHYNEVRPHEALGRKPPKQIARQLQKEYSLC